MNNFRFTKMIAGVSPLLAKETVLSKIVNMVDAFTISLSTGFNDQNIKYINTLMNLDNSKTIILETKGHDVRVKNTVDVAVKKGQKITVDFSEFTQDGNKRIYIDYPHLDKLPVGSEIVFETSQTVLKVEKQIEDYAECVVLETKNKFVAQYDRVTLEHNEDSQSILNEQDKKHILWGKEYGTHILALSACCNAGHLQNAKIFLTEQNLGDMKILAKIETKEGLKNLTEITKEADGIILIADMLVPYLEKKTIYQLINEIRECGKPVFVKYIRNPSDKNHPLYDEEVIKKLTAQGVDGLMIEAMINEEDVYSNIDTVLTMMEKHELELDKKKLTRFDEENNEIRDYILYNAYRITQELPVRSIVCFTENGYTSARIASMNPKIPVITFTKSSDTYRFLSLIWGVRGYKISQSFNYENLKVIGKEMIRMVFKGNISLDDKILIVHANEGEMSVNNDMINGVELYHFKNM
ncbi:hypothetical protein AGMMS50249_0940 [candidate division SR1 bacterium]|nr:hypothetical protein AGMMS50249_0940 [candidate division SR1 bacterium]